MDMADPLLHIVPSLSLRLLLAVLVGAWVGWERQAEHKPAGLRTHILVSLGAALFVIMGSVTPSGQPDPEQSARVIQGVITGIGFLGAGEIVGRGGLETGQVKIHGLTSAAAIWVSASLGVAAGLGYWRLSLVGALLTYLTLRVLKVLERNGS